MVRGAGEGEMGDSSSSGDSAEPLLRSPSEAAAIPSRLSVLLGQATGQRGPSLLVRQTAARQLEERRADWGFSRPVVALDIAWNVAFAVASLGVLFSTVRERPNVPIRLWIAGYALQCVVHVVLVWVEYRRRSRQRRTGGVEEGRPEASETVANQNGVEEQSGDEEAGRTQEFRYVVYQNLGGNIYYSHFFPPNRLCLGFRGFLKFVGLTLFSDIRTSEGWIKQIARNFSINDLISRGRTDGVHKTKVYVSDHAGTQYCSGVKGCHMHFQYLKI